MRPKKIILCVKKDEEDLSVLRFLLVTHRYNVLGATSGQQAIKMFREHQVDLVLSDFDMPHMNGPQIVRHLKKIASWVPILLLGDPTKMGDTLHGADAKLAKKTCSAELLDSIKVLTARKRGPRKGTLKSPRAVAAQAVELEVAAS